MRILKSTQLMIVGVAVLFVGILNFGSAFAAERIYTFDDDQAWEVITGNWEVKDGEFYSTESTTTMCAIALLKEEEEVRTEELEYISVKGYDLGTGEWQNLFIVFGYDEAEPQYYMAGSLVIAQAFYFETVDMQTHNRGADLNRVDVAGLAAETWYEMKVVFEGDTVTMFAGEEGEKLEERVSYTFPGGMPKGRVGLGASASENKYDDFIVAGPNVKPISVESHGRLTTTWGKVKAQD